MNKPAVTAAVTTLLALGASAYADTTTTEADTLVVVTPNAPVVVQQGGTAAGPSMAPGAVVAAPAPVAGNGAPQNEDWNNVSHINGTPVKVGERGDYLYQFKKTNISGNPFGAFFGYYDLAVSHALSQNLAASVAVTGWDLADGEVTGWQVSATLPLFFRRTFSGPYLEPGLLMRSTSNDCYDCSMDTSSWTGPQLLFGWQSTFDSGLNLSTAFGVAKHMGGDDDHATDVNGYFRVGYAF